MSEFINTIDTIGDEAALDGVIQRNMTEYNDDVITTIGRYGFNSWTELQSLNIPNVTSIGQFTFENCTSITEILLPNLNGAVYDGTFKTCTNLNKVDLGFCTSIRYRAFENCAAIKTVIFRNETLVPNSGTNTFGNSTGIAVYVPAALIESYKTATNWSNLYTAGTCNFVAIEGSEYE